MKREGMHPTHKLAEYMCVFLDKNLSPETVKTIKVNLITEIIAYHKVVISEFCEQHNICEFCYEKMEPNHKAECEA